MGHINTNNALLYRTTIQSVLDPLIPDGVPLALLDFPNHSNVGDSAIWLGQQTYLKDRRPSSEVAWVVDHVSAFAQPFPVLPYESVLLIHGGGNFGDLWPHHQRLREQIVKHYPNHRIIQMPQSIHFNSKDNEENSRHIFSEHRDFHLIVRDQVSLTIARKLYDCPSYLCPDMALYLGSWPRHPATSEKILALLRTDKEISVEHRTTQRYPNDILVADWVGEPNTSIKSLINNISRLERDYPNYVSVPTWIKQFLYNKIVNERMIRGCNQLADSRVVITDRLHGHILCTLMEIPHVILDNSYSKIRNFRNTWNTGEGLCHEAGTFDEAVTIAQKLIKEALNH